MSPCLLNTWRRETGTKTLRQRLLVFPGFHLFLRTFRRGGGERIQAHGIESTRDRGPIEEEIERTEDRLICWNHVEGFKSFALPLIEDANQNIADIRPSRFPRSCRVAHPCAQLFPRSR